MMELAYINEDHDESEALFMSVDNREYLYEDMAFIPVSSLSPVIWKDRETHSEEVFDITNSGALSVTEHIAEVIMSFDPYCVTVLTNSLDCFDGVSSQKRYIISINNELDIVDFDKSSIIEHTTHYDPEVHGYDVPIEEQESVTSTIIDDLFLDEDKLMSYPKNRRHAFSVKGTNNFFFSAEIYDELYKIALKGLACGLMAFKFDMAEQAPSR